MSVASAFERQMLDLINEERTSRSLEPLTLELRLNKASEDHSDWMDDTRIFSHTGAGGSDPGDRMRDAGFVFSGSWTWGENIAFQSERGAPGIADDVEDLHEALMNSPGHRANILNPNFEVIGIGIETGNGRGYEAVYVTQNFARTSAPLQLDEPSSEPTPVPTPPPTPTTPAGALLIGDNGSQILTGADGQDTLEGRGGQDTLYGNAGDDELNAGAQADRVYGGAGDDLVRGGYGADRLWGGTGADKIYGQKGSDRLFGFHGDDSLFGNQGNDQLFGQGGNDVLNGGLGSDLLVGGNGADVFVFVRGLDEVLDFDPNGDGDRVDLRNMDGVNSFQDLQSGGHVRQVGQDTHLDAGNGHVMILRNTQATILEEDDFVF